MTAPLVWRGGNDTLLVLFRDEDGRILETEFVEGQPESAWDRLRARLGW